MNDGCILKQILEMVEAGKINTEILYAFFFCADYYSVNTMRIEVIASLKEYKYLKMIMSESKPYYYLPKILRPLKFWSSSKQIIAGVQCPL